MKISSTTPKPLVQPSAEPGAFWHRAQEVLPWRGSYISVQSGASCQACRPDDEPQGVERRSRPRDKSVSCPVEGHQVDRPLAGTISPYEGRFVHFPYSGLFRCLGRALRIARSLAVTKSGRQDSNLRPSAPKALNRRPWKVLVSTGIMAINALHHSCLAFQRMAADARSCQAEGVDLLTCLLTWAALGPRIAGLPSSAQACGSPWSSGAQGVVGGCPTFVAAPA